MIRIEKKTAGLAIGLAIGALPLVAQAQDTADWQPPKLDWGVPDVQGTWNYQTRSSLERPANYNGKLEITEQEKQDLLAFLRALTDEDLLSSPKFSDPFAE